MAEAAAQLDYGRRPKRRRLLWRAVALLGFVAIGAAVLVWGPTWKHRWAVFLDQRRCMNYRAPPDQVVYEAPLNEMGLRPEVTACYSPPCWTRSRTRSSPGAVIFLHERTSPCGNRRLVCIEATPVLRGTYAGLSMLPHWSFRVLIPSSPLGQPADVQQGPYGDGDPSLFILGADRFYAGQPDPSDPSHFVLVYESGGERNTVDGWPRDDDTLTFRFRRTAVDEADTGPGIGGDERVSAADWVQAAEEPAAQEL